MTKIKSLFKCLVDYRRVGPGPPLEIEKQKKKVTRANNRLFQLYFAIF